MSSHETLNSAFSQAAAAHSAALGRDLPFKMAGWMEKKPYHQRLVSYWQLEHGRPPHGRTPVSIVLGIATNEGRRKGYNSGIESLEIEHEFHGQGIGKTLVRNAFDLFHRNGDRLIDVNTATMGAIFWQAIGFTAIAEDRDLNNEDDIFSDWDPGNMYRCNARQIKEIFSKLESYKAADLIDQEQYDRVRGVIREDDPQSIWDFLDLKDTITYKDHYTRETVTENLARACIGGLKLALQFNLSSNSQMERFLDKTKDAAVDTKKFGHDTSRYIAVERARYEEQRIWDGIMSRKL